MLSREKSFFDTPFIFWYCFFGGGVLMLVKFCHNNKDEDNIPSNNKKFRQDIFLPIEMKYSCFFGVFFFMEIKLTRCYKLHVFVAIIILKNFLIKNFKFWGFFYFIYFCFTNLKYYLSQVLKKNVSFFL